MKIAVIERMIEMASISKRQDGTWLGQVNKNGKRKSFYGNTKKEVEKKIREYEEDLNKYGTELKKCTINLKEWVNTHLFTNVLNNVEASTFERYKGLYDNYIKKCNVADMLLPDIRQIHLQEYFNTLSSLSLPSMKKLKTLLNGAFEAAIDNHLIRINPIKKIKLPTSDVEEKDIRVFTIEEQKRYMIALKSELYGLLYYLTLFTGLRLGEIAALKWGHVDFNQGVLSVEQTIKQSKVYNKDGTYKKKLVTKDPKTKKSIRVIPIPTKLLDELNILKSNSKSDYIFSSSNGTPLSANNIRKYHIRICTRAKIGNPTHTTYHRTYKHIDGTFHKKDIIKTEYNDVNFHALRHTYATRLLEVGENIKTISELLGHKDIKTTLNIYAHVLEDTKKSAVDKLTQLIDEMQ